MSLTTIQKGDQYVPVHDILTLTNNNLKIVFDPCEKPYITWIQVVVIVHGNNMYTPIVKHFTFIGYMYYLCHLRRVSK